MDNVPQLFVDIVIGLFGQESLNSIVELDESLWSSIGKVYADNRRYFLMHVGKVDREFVFSFIEFCFRGGTRVVRIQPSDLKLLKPQYLRIRSVYGMLGLRGRFRDDELLHVGEEQIQTFLSQFANCFGNHCHLHLVRKLRPLSEDDERVLSPKEFSDSVRLFLRAFYKRAYFNAVSLSYIGSESEDFLKDHIYNHRLLRGVHLREDWPPSILQDVEYFIRKGEKRNLSLPPKFHVDREFIIDLFDLWKSDGEFECSLSYDSQAESPPFLEAMTQSSTDEKSFYLKHGFKKSVAMYYVSDGQISLSFEECSCNVSECCSFCSCEL